MGDTPLDIAITQGRYRVMDMLRSAGGKVGNYGVPIYLTYVYSLCSIRFIHLSYGTLLYGQIYVQ